MQRQVQDNEVLLRLKEEDYFFLSQFMMSKMPITNSDFYTFTLEADSNNLVITEPLPYTVYINRDDDLDGSLICASVSSLGSHSLAQNLFGGNAVNIAQVFTDDNRAVLDTNGQYVYALVQTIQSENQSCDANTVQLSFVSKEINGFEPLTLDKDTYKVNFACMYSMLYAVKFNKISGLIGNSSNIGGLSLEELESKFRPKEGSANIVDVVKEAEENTNEAICSKQFEGIITTNEAQNLWENLNNG